MAAGGTTSSNGGRAAEALGLVAGRWPDRVASVERDGVTIVIGLEGPGAAPATAFVEPLDGSRGHFRRTSRLGLGYRGATAHPALLAFLDNLAKRLGDRDIDDLAGALGVGPAPAASPDPAGAPPGGPSPSAQPDDAPRGWPGMHRCFDHPDAWMHFFSDAEVSQEGTSSLDFQGEGRWPALVYHSPFECVDLCPKHFVELPWASRDRRVTRRMPSRLHLYTGVDDVDVVAGGLPKLRDALAEVRRLGAGGSPPATTMVAVHVGCIPQITGEDVEAVLDRERACAPYPIFASGSRSEAEPWRHWIREVRAAVLASDCPRDPAAVTLAGFRAGPDRDELVRDLRRLGVRVAATPFPVVSMEDAARLRGAALSVLSPDASWEPVYAGLLDGIGVPSLVAPAPYGFAGTSAFLAAVAAALGLPDVARRADRPRGGRTRERFDRLRSEAAGHRVGIVCEASRVARVRDARLHWGVPLAPTLEELGFDVRVAAAGPGNGRIAGADGQGTSDPAAGADRVRSAAELREWLRDTRVAAVYTDYAFDARLADAGVAPFGLGVFEMGFAGAVRTVERLLRRCRMGFFRLGAAGGA